jgi:hypothetical protein
MPRREPFPAARDRSAIVRQVRKHHSQACTRAPSKGVRARESSTPVVLGDIEAAAGIGTRGFQVQPEQSS